MTGAQRFLKPNLEPDDAAFTDPAGGSFSLTPLRRDFLGDDASSGDSISLLRAAI